jgi:hypothetical protein
MTADDSNAPFIDIVDGITSHTDWNTVGKIKSRLGKLTGVTSPTMGTLSGYGLWSSNVYLEGNANVVGTLAVGGGNTVGNTFYVGRVATNLFRGSETITGWSQLAATVTISSSNEVGNPSSPTGYAIKFVRNATGTARKSFNDVSTFNTARVVTISFWARTASGTGSLRIGINDGEQTVTGITTTWKRFSYTRTVTTLLGTYCFMDIESFPDNTGTYLWGFQVED